MCKVLLENVKFITHSHEEIIVRLWQEESGPQFVKHARCMFENNFQLIFVDSTFHEEGLSSNFFCARLNDERDESHKENILKKIAQGGVAADEQLKLYYYNYIKN